MYKPFIVGITGGSASGKTLFLKRLLDSFNPADVCLLSQDNYYKPRNQQPIDENGIYNFDTPNSINFDEYANDLGMLKNNQQVKRVEYTFNNPDKNGELLVFNPSPIIVVEGIFVFYYPELSSLIDLKIFIDAYEHVKLTRRIYRDQNERGYGLEDVLYRYEKHVAPTYEKYIKPFKNDADIVIPNNHSFDKALEVIIQFLKSKIK
jgi:uridine kinase